MGKIQVKIFEVSWDSEDFLEDVLNEYLEETEGKFIDIKYSTMLNCDCAMVVEEFE